MGDNKHQLTVSAPQQLGSVFHSRTARKAWMSLHLAQWCGKSWQMIFLLYLGYRRLGPWHLLDLIATGLWSIGCHVMLILDVPQCPNGQYDNPPGQPRSCWHSRTGGGRWGFLYPGSWMFWWCDGAEDVTTFPWQLDSEGLIKPRPQLSSM